MSFPTFNLSRFYSLRNRDGDQLTFSAFNGESSITVWKKGDQGKPSIKIKIGVYAANRLTKKLKDLLTTTTEARLPMVFNTYNKESNSYEVSSNIVLVKDDKARYYIELSSNGASAKFTIVASQAISDGDSAVTLESRSREGVIELITVLDKYVPMADIASSYREPNTKAAGGNNQQSFKKQSKDPFNKPSSSVAVDDVDTPF